MDPGGVETWLMHVLRNIDRERFQFHFCTSGRHAGLYAGEIEKLGGKVLRCPKGANLWSFARRFRRILREGNYDVVHSHVHFFSGAVLRWAKAEGVPIRIAHSHNSYDGKPNSRVRNSYRRLMHSWINCYATHGLAASRPAAADLFGQRWQEDGRFAVLHYGIDLDSFRRPFVRDEVRRELGIPCSAIVVGHVGRFAPQKNHAFLLEIAAEIFKVRPDMHFLLVGEGPFRLEIEARAEAMGFNGRMHFVGTRTDIPRLMLAAMDVFVFPSLWEGLPVTLIEAQAAGLHCVVSDAVPEEIALRPEAVEFLPVFAGANHWATQVIRGLETPRRSLASILDAASRSQFSIQNSVRELTSVYSAMQQSSAPTAAEYAES
jgi:glycosyltransferase involved in cell wall biosynthesis